MQVRAFSLGVASFAALVLATVTAVCASGTALVQQSDGATNTYNVTIKYVHDSVRITVPDKHDTLTFWHAACSFAGALQRCLPYKISLNRNGTSHAIAFEHGTVYMNLTDARQQLPHSSKELPPKGVLLAIRTAHGTYITVKGTLDEVTP